MKNKDVHAAAFIGVIRFVDLMIVDGLQELKNEPL